MLGPHRGMPYKLMFVSLKTTLFPLIASRRKIGGRLYYNPSEELQLLLGKEIIYTTKVSFNQSDHSVALLFLAYGCGTYSFTVIWDLGDTPVSHLHLRHTPPCPHCVAATLVLHDNQGQLLLQTQSINIRSLK